MEIGITIFIAAIILACIAGPRLISRIVAKELNKNNKNTEKKSESVTEKDKDNKKKSKKRGISFKDKYHNVGLPVITLNIMSNQYSFILDTGANFNALDKEEFKRIVSENGIDMDFSKIESNDSEDIVVTGVGGQQGNIKEVKIPLKIAGLDFEEIFSLVDIGQALNQYGRNGTKLSGVIGSDFFHRYGWQIDFEELVVWINSN